MEDVTRNDIDDIVIPDIAPLESRYAQLNNSISSIETRLQGLVQRQEEIQKNSHLWVLNDNSLGNIAGTIASRRPTLGEMHSVGDTNNRIIQELLDE
jgi:hypothetical protein